MKPSVIIALVVGGVVGFAVGNVFRSSSGSTGTAVVAPSGNPQARAAAAPGQDSIFKVPLEQSAILGKGDALVTVVEFSDYQCPFCSRAHVTVQQLEKDYGDKIRVVMKQNPLPFHDRAKPSAQAALAAGEQGKFWEMHDKMFANQQNLQEANLEQYARDIGLNVDKWKADMGSAKVAAQIEQEQKLAASLGATGTPAFFINGRKLSGAQPVDAFKKIIDEEMAKAQQMVASGTSADKVYARVIENGVTAPPPAAPSAPSAPSAPAPSAIRKIDVPADSPARGAKYAKVTIVEWSDFQCPFCGRVAPTLKQIEDTYGKDVKIVFRQQPLPFHNNAKPAAEASLAAHEQGKFWPYHDKLFANQQALDRASLEKYASELGLDMGKFKAALDSNKFTKAVEADSAAGMAAGANGTPTFFINGRELVGAQPFEAFKSAIDDELKKADAVMAKGVKLENVYAELQKNAGSAPPPGQAEEAKVLGPNDLNIVGAPVKGPKNAPVTIVAFSDFQCPFCSRVVPTLKEIEKQYEGKVKIAFKNQPLPFHNNARGAAAAGLAANEQGKFWEMHDKMFANQQALDRASLEKYASEIGLDMGKFKAALDSNKFESVIAADSAEGAKVGANGTPTFFINGRQVVGAQPIESFKTIIDDELAKKKK